MGTAAELKVKKLAQIKSNCVCPNCGTCKKYGFGSVCIKFYTFVCNECKSSHQAISHRCKSLTMSSWTDEEVAALERGGNNVARDTWLANAPPVGTSGRPQQGSDLNVFKRFVVDAYERQKFKGTANSRLAVPPVAPVAVEQQQQRQQRQPVQRAVPRARPTPTAPPVADLLDFSSPPAPAAQTLKAPSTEFFAADFSFAPAPAVPTQALMAPTTATTNNTNSDPFGDFASFSHPTGPVGNSTLNTASNRDYSTTTTTTSNKPIMGSGVSNATAISMMAQPATSMNMKPQQHQQQNQQMDMQLNGMNNMHTGMNNMHTGMNNMNNNGNMNRMNMMHNGGGGGGMPMMNAMNGSGMRQQQQQQPMMMMNNGMQGMNSSNGSGGMMMMNNGGTMMNNTMGMGNNAMQHQQYPQQQTAMMNGMNGGMNHINNGMAVMNNGMNQSSLNNIDAFGSFPMQNNNGRKS